MGVLELWWAVAFDGGPAMGERREDREDRVKRDTERENNK